MFVIAAIEQIILSVLILFLLTLAAMHLTVKTRC